SVSFHTDPDCHFLGHAGSIRRRLGRGSLVPAGQILLLVAGVEDARHLPALAAVRNESVSIGASTTQRATGLFLLVGGPPGGGVPGLRHRLAQPPVPELPPPRRVGLRLPGAARPRGHRPTCRVAAPGVQVVLPRVVVEEGITEWLAPQGGLERLEGGLTGEE